MSKTETGQVNKSAAEVYEEYFIPALFQEWAGKVANEAEIQQGQKVLDVACGTGVLAREVLKRVGSEGSVFGLDINEGMLAVAREKNPSIEWRKGAAESIPFEDESFDTVISQFGLMFFVDKTSAIKEMFRVLKSGGRIAIAVWGSLENAVGYKKVVEILQRLFGDEAADSLRSPYSLGDVQVLKSLFEDAGIENAEIKTLEGKARFPSIESWMFTDVKGWTLADILDDSQYQLLLNEAEKELRPFLTDEGTVSFDHPAHIIVAKKV
jgi:ubiquinone/menaquinone biosynthesis C-methylase UbiE